MKRLFATLLVFLSTHSNAQSHDHHVRHNMVVYGHDEVFISHIVYKQPHNFQVILKVTFPDTVLESYQSMRRAHPNDTYIFLLDPSEIGEIRHAEQLTGTLFKRDNNGQRTDIATSLNLENESFSVVYFQELPLSLEQD